MKKDKSIRDENVPETAGRIMERGKKTNVWVMAEVTRICGRELEGFFEPVKRREFKFYGHVVRGRGIARAVMERGMEGRRGRGMEGGMEGRRGRGRPPENLMSNLKGWNGKTGMQLKEMAKNREVWRNAAEQWVHPRPDG